MSECRDKQAQIWWLLAQEEGFAEHARSIPNFPFFYLAFRAWSHYKGWLRSSSLLGTVLMEIALYGSKYLEFVLDQKLIEPTPSTALDELYAAGLIHPTREKLRGAEVPSEEETTAVAKLVRSQTNDETEEVMLLRRWNGKLLAERFHLPEMEVEIERAVEQVEKGIKAKQELMEEKREIEKAVEKPSQRGKD